MHLPSRTSRKLESNRNLHRLQELHPRDWFSLGICSCIAPAIAPAQIGTGGQAGKSCGFLTDRHCWGWGGGVSGGNGIMKWRKVATYSEIQQLKGKIISLATQKISSVFFKTLYSRMWILPPSSTQGTWSKWSLTTTLGQLTPGIFQDGTKIT